MEASDNRRNETTVSEIKQRTQERNRQSMGDVVAKQCEELEELQRQGRQDQDYNTIWEVMSKWNRRGSTAVQDKIC